MAFFDENKGHKSRTKRKIRTRLGDTMAQTWNDPSESKSVLGIINATSTILVGNKIGATIF